MKICSRRPSKAGVSPLIYSRQERPMGEYREDYVKLENVSKIYGAQGNADRGGG